MNVIDFVFERIVTSRQPDSQTDRQNGKLIMINVHAMYALDEEKQLANTVWIG